MATDVVRGWIEERSIKVTFREYTYFFTAMAELSAESVQRYSEYQAEVVKQARALYLAGVMHQLRTPLSTLSTQFALLTRTGRTPDAAFLARVNLAATRLQVLRDRRVLAARRAWRLTAIDRSAPAWAPRGPPKKRNTGRSQPTATPCPHFRTPRVAWQACAPALPSPPR
jgi:signal transduction histidine kinase